MGNTLVAPDAPGDPRAPAATDAAGVTSATRKRIRNPEAHRAAILEAARVEFAARGYARATIREIARRSGVANGLVLRHFGSKENLFMAAVPGPQDLADLVQGDPETLPERVAHGYVARMERAGGDDPFLALIRAAGSNEDAAVRLYAVMHERSVAVYRATMAEPPSGAQIELTAALMIGVTFSRYIMKRGPLAQMPVQPLEHYLAGAIRAILFT
jgi:AcrR family transcriptional regulator